ncbi:MAG: hypothetical protein LBS61_04925 [Endomicrobium sp.]|jgi:hypothetical protein|nr:hypothetical protein [Endomicrobium sp.]
MKIFIKMFLSTVLFILAFTTNIFALGDISLGSRVFPLRINGVDNMLVNDVKDTDGDRNLVMGAIGAEYFHDVKGGFKIGVGLEDANTGRMNLRIG